jgi:hypothetical protein
VVYPDYIITFGTNQKVTLYDVDLDTNSLRIEGTCAFINSNEIEFDKEFSEILKDIGYFDVEPASNRYSIVEEKSDELKIEYSFDSTDGKTYIEGFWFFRQ